MSNQTYIGTTEAAHYLGISTVRLRILLQQGRVEGARKEGRVWTIPLFKGMPVIDERRKGPKGTWYKRRREAPTASWSTGKLLAKTPRKMRTSPRSWSKKAKIKHNCHELEIKGHCRLVYTPHETGPCGARLWIEAEANVPVIRKMFATVPTPKAPFEL
jgi:hypothetical protein